VVGRLKESGGLVIARIAGDKVVIRPHVGAVIFLLGAGAFARSAVDGTGARGASTSA